MSFAQLKIHVDQIKEIVTLMMNVKRVFSVDQTIVQALLDFILNLIAVMSQLLEMWIVGTIMLLFVMNVQMVMVPHGAMEIVNGIQLQMNAK